MGLGPEPAELLMEWFREQEPELRERVVRYLDRLSPVALERVIEAHDWTDGCFVTLDGKCLVAHAAGSMRHFTGQPDLDSAILGREMKVPEAFDLLCGFEGLEETVTWVQGQVRRRMNPALTTPLTCTPLPHP